MTQRIDATYKVERILRSEREYVPEDLTDGHSLEAIEVGDLVHFEQWPNGEHVATCGVVVAKMEDDGGDHVYVKMPLAEIGIVGREIYMCYVTEITSVERKVN